MQVHGENEAALRGWNQIEEEEFYREPPTYLQTEMAEFVPKKGVQNSGMDKSRERVERGERKSLAGSMMTDRSPDEISCGGSFLSLDS